MFDDNLTVTSVSFFVENFNLLSYEFDNFKCKAFTVPSGKSRIVFFDFFNDGKHCCLVSTFQISDLLHKFWTGIKGFLFSSWSYETER